MLLAAVDSIGRTGGTNPGPAAPSTDTGGSANGQKIAEVASGYVGMSDFPYAAGTNGGRKGCAQVVSTILKDAGAVDSVQLGVLDVLSDLRGRGWADIQPPPWHDGDVVTWSTYDRDGDGVNDPDTHIGIIKMVDGEPWAINNSSSQLQPVMKELAAMPYPVSHVLRGS